jgi:hypothetical protein
MDGLSAVGVICQFGFDPNTTLTPEGKLETFEGNECDPASSESTHNSYLSDDSVEKKR